MTLWLCWLGVASVTMIASVKVFLEASYAFLTTDQNEISMTTEMGV